MEFVIDDDVFIFYVSVYYTFTENVLHSTSYLLIKRKLVIFLNHMNNSSVDFIPIVSKDQTFFSATPLSK